MKVKDCMCTDVCCVKPETTVHDVAKLMCQNHIGSIPVCDTNNCLCGIVTDRDIILRTIACDKDVKTTPVSDIMSTNVCTCDENEDMSNAENKMGTNKVRRLPVCDNNKKVIGILTLGDIAQNRAKLDDREICITFEDVCDCDTNKNAE